MSDVTHPLLILGVKLRSVGPPSLQMLIAHIQDAEEYEDFWRLVIELLPEREREILDEPTPGEQIAAFASFFEDRYFPLQDGLREGDAEGYSDLTYQIPVVVMGSRCPRP